MTQRAESGRANAALPSFAQIEPVLRCRMCPIRSRADGPPVFMDIDTFRRPIDQFPGMTELHLQGMGEPLMHPRFFDTVRYAVARGIEVSINTNLTLLSERRAVVCYASQLRGLATPGWPGPHDILAPERYWRLALH